VEHLVQHLELVLLVTMVVLVAWVVAVEGEVDQIPLKPAMEALGEAVVVLLLEAVLVVRGFLVVVAV
jgi:hypothetical protein